MQKARSVISIGRRSSVSPREGTFVCAHTHGHACMQYGAFGGQRTTFGSRFCTLLSLWHTLSCQFSCLHVSPCCILLCWDYRFRPPNLAFCGYQE